MAGEILNPHLVFFLHLFQDNVYSLYSKNSSFLTYQDWYITPDRVDVL